MNNKYLEQKFIQNLDIETYHSLKEFVSSSRLKELAKSPAHYKAALESPWKRTAALEFGDAAHCYMLQPKEFERRFATMPATIIEKLVGIADSFRNHKTASLFLGSDSGIAEMSCFFLDPETGILCRIRPDFLPGGAVISDYKTTENASPAEFQRSCVKYRYDIQAGFYTYGMEILTGVPHRFVFIAHEKKPPYEIAVYEASPEFIAIGQAKAKALLATLAECRRTGIYPGYPDEIQTLDLPAWAAKAA